MKQYYIIRNEKPAGPYTLEELGTMSITLETMVWDEGLTEWLPAHQLGELNSLFATTSQTPPSKTTPSYGTPSAPQHHSAPQYSSTYSPPPSERPPMPPNYLAWSIVVTVFCCRIIGIIALIYSSQVTSRYIAGDYKGAAKSSRKARTWLLVPVYFWGFVLIVSAIVGIVSLLTDLIS